MWTLALACAFFLSIHLMISGTELKELILGKIGGWAYYTLFSLISIGGFLWMVIAFFIAMNDRGNFILWGAPLFLKIIALVVNFVAFLLIVLGLTTPSPTNLPALFNMPDRAVLRHHPRVAPPGAGRRRPVGADPFHLQRQTWQAGCSSARCWPLCAIGANNIDRKREAMMGNVYVSIKKRTSIIPFIAIIEGRNAFAPEELGIARVFLAASMFSVFLVLHEMLFTARAL